MKRETKESLHQKYPEASEEVLEILCSCGGGIRKGPKIVHNEEADMVCHLANGGSPEEIHESTRTSPVAVCPHSSVDLPSSDTKLTEQEEAELEEILEGRAEALGVCTEVAEIMDSFEIENTGSYSCPARFDEDHDSPNEA